VDLKSKRIDFRPFEVSGSFSHPHVSTQSVFGGRRCGVGLGLWSRMLDGEPRFERSFDIGEEPLAVKDDLLRALPVGCALWSLTRLMTSADEVVFVPSRIDGMASSNTVAIRRDRLEIITPAGVVVHMFEDFARWPQPVALWRVLFRLGYRMSRLDIGDRDWFHDPPDRYFRFYTSPPTTICMPDDAADDAASTFSRVRDVMERGGFTTRDLGWAAACRLDIRKIPTRRLTGTGCAAQ
jgi:hypothetical protein